METNIIAAVAKNLAIGYKNKLIYWLPNDLKRFKQITSGHTIIMGRKTYESLPNGALPNRTNIVLSKTIKDIDKCIVFDDLNKALSFCKNQDKVFIIGGETLYRKALNIADNLYLTEIDDMPIDADAFFPTYNDWELTSLEKHKKDNDHDYNFQFANYKRKR